jgi:hypothetical protein
MRISVWLGLVVIITSSVASSQDSLLSYFAGEWEGTVKYYNPEGKEIGKYKARRSLEFVSEDTLRGIFELQYDSRKAQRTELTIVDNGDDFLLLQPTGVLHGKYKDRVFTFQGEIDSLGSAILESHFFVGGDQEFFTIEQTDPKTKKKIVFMRGVLKLKKN